MFALTSMVFFEVAEGARGQLLVVNSKPLPTTKERACSHFVVRHARRALSALLSIREMTSILNAAAKKENKKQDWNRYSQ
jgi:hypothetical protein